MSAADQLAAIEAQMAQVERRHQRLLWHWRRLRRERDALRVMVAREERDELRQARKFCGPDVRRSA